MGKKEKAVRIIVKCMNEQCNNYKQEMNEGVEECSLCKEPVTKIESYVNPKLARIAIAAAIISTIILMFNFWALWLDFVAAAVVVGVVVVAIISKSKPAIIVTILNVFAFAGLFIYYFFLS